MKLRVIYNSVLKRVTLVNVTSGKELEYGHTACLGKYNPSSGNKVLASDIEKLVEDIAKNYSDEKVKISVHSSEEMVELFRTTIEKSGFDNLSFEQNLSQYVMEDANTVYQTLFDFGGIVVKDVSEVIDVETEGLGSNVLNVVEECSKMRDELKAVDVIICVTGVYSMGKSTFINSLIGKRILPGSDNRSTAKLCKIVKGDKLQIEFELNDGSQVKITDFSEQGCKIICQNMHPIVTHIQEALSAVLATCVEDYVYSVLHAINDFYNSGNKKDIIRGMVDVIVPYNVFGDLKYVIYDTPGTGTSSKRDEQELRNIINAPIKPITIILNTSTSIDLMGTSNLMYMIKANENIDYAMYVINKADQSSVSELAQLRTNVKLTDGSEEDEDEAETIELRDKQLFFVSSNGAMVANALCEGLNPEAFVMQAQRCEERINDAQHGCYYTLDCIGGAESVRTQKLKQACEEELALAFKARKPNEARGRTLMVNSGMFALKQALKEFAETNTLTLKTETLYVEYKRLLSLALDYFRNERHIHTLSAEQRKAEAEILEKTLIEGVRTAAVGSVEYVKQVLDSEYNAAGEEYRDIVSKDSKILAKIEKIKLKKKLKKNTENFKDLYLKMFDMFPEKHYNRVLKSSFFHGNVQKMEKKVNRNVEAIQEVMDKLDSEYTDIRKSELKRFSKIMIVNIQNAIDISGDLSAETRKAIKSAPEIKVKERYLREFDFEQYREKKTKGKEVKKGMYEWYKLCLESRRRMYVKDMVESMAKIADQVFASYANNMKQLASQLTKIEENRESVEQEIAAINDKMSRLESLMLRLEEIVGN